MYVTNFTDVYEIDIHLVFTISIDKIVPTFLLTIPCGLSF